MNRESIQKSYGLKDDTGKANFCLRIIGRLKCCESLDEAVEICKLATVVMTNKKVTTVVEKSVQELEKTIYCFDMLPQIERVAGCCTTKEDVQEVIIDTASPWKGLWDKELTNYCAEKKCNKKLQGKGKQNKYFMNSYYHQEFRR